MTKKKHTHVLLLLIVVLFSAVFLEANEMNPIKKTSDHSKIPPGAELFIQALREPTIFQHIPPVWPDEFMAVRANKCSDCPDQITAQQAREDIDLIEYLFENAYSGRYFFEQNGTVDFPAMYKALRRLADGEKEVSPVVMEDILVERLSGIRNDDHLGIIGRHHTRFFKAPPTVFFTDVLLEQRDKNWVVLRSEEPEIKLGAVYRGTAESLFPTLSPIGRHHALLGIRADKNPGEAEFTFKGATVSLPLHPCRIAGYKARADSELPCIAGRADGPFDVQEREGIPVVSLRTLHRHEEELTKFSNYGTCLKESARFVFDLCGNGGGNSSFGNRFLRNINGATYTDYEGTVYANLFSPAILQARLFCRDHSTPEQWEKDVAEIESSTPERLWEIKTIHEEEPATYKGKAIILINRRTFSSGQSVAKSAKAIPDSLLVGESTATGGPFGDLLYYRLPHSRILFLFPFNFSFNLDDGEEYLKPDLWLDSDDPVSEVIRWLNAPTDYRFSPESSGR